MKAFVISLVDSHQRRTNLTKILSDAKVEFEFFDAIRGTDQNNISLTGYDDKRCQRERGYSLTLGERGCFASHRSLWMKCIELNQPILIMEDDVYFAGDIQWVYPKLDELSRHYDYLKLGHCGYKKFMGGAAFLSHCHVADDDHHVVKYLRGQRGAHAYLITPIAAKKWVDNSMRWWQPVDDYQETESLHGVWDMGLEPQLAFQSDVPSDIGDRGGRHSNNQCKKILVQLYRNKYDLLKAWSNIKFYVQKCAKQRSGHI